MVNRPAAIRPRRARFSPGAADSTFIPESSVRDVPCLDLIVASSFAIWLLDGLQEASRAFGLHFLTDNVVPDL